MNIPFRKMHGLGNDFVIIDTRGFEAPFIDSLSADYIQYLGDRRRGIGFDQLILIEPAKGDGADAYMRILNNDGSEAEACGNATRCVAHILMQELDAQNCTIQTIAGFLHCEYVDSEGGRTPFIRAGLAKGGSAPFIRAGLAKGGSAPFIKVNMGQPRLNWDEIPLRDDVDTLGLGFNIGPLMLPCAVNIGNPHAVFFVDDVDGIDLEHWGPQVEHHEMFPKKTNVEIAHIINKKTIRMRVWERGVGITQACGSAACATMVAAVRRDLVERKAIVELDGGPLSFYWDEASNDLFMTGPVSFVFEGQTKL